MNLKLPKDVDEIINILYEEGYEAYAVGGCVRDSILTKTPNDWDICTSAKPEVMMRLFEYYGLKVIPTGIKHGTVTVIQSNNSYEITTYRVEGEYEDNRRPKNVEFSRDIEEDLNRRDFTINSMAYNSENGLIDPFDGRRDLHNGIIRAVGDPEKRFSEDALRILRGIRFATQLNFDIEEKTLRAMRDKGHLLEKISSERKREELNKILLSSIPSKGFKLMKDLSLLKHIIPDLVPCIDFDQRNPNHNKDVFDHTMMVVDNTKINLITRLAALLHDIGKPQTFSLDDDGIGHFYKHTRVGERMASEVLRRLSYDNLTIKRVTILVKEHMSKYDQLSDKAIKRFINRVGRENLQNLFDLQRADVIASTLPHDFSKIEYMEKRCSEIIERGEPLTVKDLNINGYDLIKVGIEPGKEMGAILNYLLNLALEDPNINEKQVLLSIVKDKFL